MSRLRKIFMMALIAAIISFVMVGCKDKHEHLSGEPNSSEHPTSEHPK
jgi:hypothetical protein